MPTGSGPWRAVDEGHSGGFESGQLTGQIAGAIRDVVEALAAALQETADRGVGAEGFDQLDRADESDADALGFEGFGGGAGVTGDELVGMTARFDGTDGDGDVIDDVTGRFHARMLRAAKYSDKEI
jgi:hypothetical protein